MNRNRMDALRGVSLVVSMVSSGGLLALNHVEGEPSWSRYALIAALIGGGMLGAFALSRGAQS